MDDMRYDYCLWMPSIHHVPAAFIWNRLDKCTVTRSTRFRNWDLEFAQRLIRAQPHAVAASGMLKRATRGESFSQLAATDP